MGCSAVLVQCPPPPFPPLSSPQVTHVASEALAQIWEGMSFAEMKEMTETKFQQTGLKISFRDDDGDSVVINDRCVRVFVSKGGGVNVCLSTLLIECFVSRECPSG